MRRDFAALEGTVYDVLVVGGGIYGACAVWDAAQRGLTVALVEKGDFGHATSSNSMKTVHGGLRYLQDFNLRLMRNMINERRAWLTIAPHLVRPLPMLFPTRDRGLHSKEALALALKITDWMGYDRNRGLGEETSLPPSRVLGRKEVLENLPGLPKSTEVSAAAMWYDAQIYNTEQLLISILKSAVGQGAVVANYVRAESILLVEGSAKGARVRDLDSGQTLDVRARFVINAAGPWVEQFLSPHTNERPRYPLSRAVNVIVPKIIEGVGVGLRSNIQMKDDTKRPRAGKTLFVVPWRDLSIIGTMHGPPVERPDEVGPVDPEIERLIEGINEAYPGAGLDRGSVRMVHSGLQPLDPGRAGHLRPDILRESELVDHARVHGIQGLISLIGVKYTSARWLAERAVDHAVHRLQIPVSSSRTKDTPVSGGHLQSVKDEVSALQKRNPELSRASIEQLVQTYGSEAQRVLAWGRGDSSNLELIDGQEKVLRCQVLYAVHEEMIRKPSDFVLRRSELGADGPPPEAAVQDVVRIMSEALDWPAHMQQETKREYKHSEPSSH